MAAQSTTGGSAGFALVEALASLVIVGMIGLLLVAGATTGRRTWERIDSRQARGDLSPVIARPLHRRGRRPAQRP